MKYRTQDGAEFELADAQRAEIEHASPRQYEGWVIKNAAGNLLQSVALNQAEIQIGWYRPGAQVKTAVGKKGPLTFNLEHKASTLLMALLAQLPTEFANSSVVPFSLAK